MLINANDLGKRVGAMTVGFVLFLAFVAVLVVGWVVLTVKQPPRKRRVSADFRHQHTENPDHFPGHAGGATGG